MNDANPDSRAESSFAKRTRVAILGAGPAGLAAAWGLSNSASLRERFEVTVYQVGWRAGGKVASGRIGIENRIRQNGTHYLFGCYDNSFELCRQAYDELNALGDHRFGTFEQAFIPLTFLALKQRFRGEWHDWLVSLPTNRHVPGDHTSELEPSQILSMVLQWVVESVAGWKLGSRLRPEPPFAPGFAPPPWWTAVASEVFDVTVHGLLALANRLVRPTRQGNEFPGAIAWLLDQARRGAWAHLERRAATDLDACRQWMLLDLACSFITGLIRDKALEPGGMGELDRYDYREWLARHGASELTLASPLVTGWYDSIAAYEDGDVRRPNVSAGATVYALLYAGFGYKGAFAYQPARELGDTWVAPLYAALERRGVRFKFFHRVWNLEAKDGAIERITVENQLPGAALDGYDPFVSVCRRAAWPDQPLYERLGNVPVQPDPRNPDGPPLDPRDFDLEDFYTRWRGEQRDLLRRRDFDSVIYAMPVGTVAHYCSQLVAQSTAWRELVQHLQGVDTQSLWLYFKPTLAELGWQYPRPVLTAYAQPFSTWEEMSYLVECETWPASDVPGTVCSLFGSMSGPTYAPGPDDPGTYPDDQRAQLQRAVHHFCTEQVGALWPRATDPGSRCLDWSLLVDLEHRAAAARLQFQGKQANYGPAQRYTAARAGTLRYRLRADETGYANLYVAGDWTRNGTEIGCVEGAVKSGLLAAIALSGEGSIIGGDSKSGLL
jgi:uncharacterized protein with NAD-binding domain and iron-sulfur cluster